VPTDGVDGPAHATVPIGFGHGEETAVVATPEKKVSGWWCWIHQDGSVGMCAREHDECEATRTGFNQTAENLGDVASKNECKQQKTAWETESSRPLPTQAMCKAARDKGETCRQLK